MHEFPSLHECWYLTGATASGKTRIALKLAQALNAEIISLDSMAVYSGMDIGTAKPTLEERETVVHHLLDVVAPNNAFSLSDYLQAAHLAAHEIRQRDREVLFVGGTPLYLKSLLRGVCEGPPSDAEFRKDVEEEVERIGIEALRERLEQVDPLSAAKLHPHDKRRMIRALEVYKLTGVPISHYQLQFDQPPTQPCNRVFVLSWERSQLHVRINERVDRMFEHGLVDEVRALLATYGEFSDTALQGVGYREVLELLADKRTLKSSIEQTKIRTRRFARRQETWFRGLSECKWISLTNESQDEAVLEQIQATT